MSSPGHAGYATESFDPRDIIAGNAHLHDEDIVLASGQNLLRGAVLGRITVGGKCVLSVADAVDGSQTPVGILAFDCDASDADTNASMYTSGEFEQNALTYGDGHAPDTVKAAFAGTPLYLINVAP